MFRIRRVIDDVLPLNRQALTQVQEILRRQFPGLRDEEITSLPEKLNNPFKFGFRHFLFVVDDLRGNVKGFALVGHEPRLRFCYLDYLASAGRLTGAGFGGALYDWVRHEARALRGIGLFFECLPDDPAEVPNAAELRANISRLRFYERFGARPITNNAYQEPIDPGDKGYPYLVFDDLGTGRLPRRDEIRKIVRAILVRKYTTLCPPAYVDRVVKSFLDDPIQLRPYRYVRRHAAAPHAPAKPSAAGTIALVVSDRHETHDVRERGYVEAPVRIPAILKAIEPTGLFTRVPPREYGEAHIRAVHDGGFVDYLKRICRGLPAGRSVYPYVFPLRNPARPPLDLAVRAGYYCIDTFTPLNRNAYDAARRAVDCALTAADELLRGRRLAYALVRPPGHHAERRVFGGFCYFNSAAIAANYLSRLGRVAILDIDYHHGNGQQDIFYQRADVLTISIHGHPRFAYPYFSGFEEERGEDAGLGFNVNFPMPESVDGERFRGVLARAMVRIRRFAPLTLIVAFGVDSARGDPTGTWSLRSEDFRVNGRMIGESAIPTLVVQEGGYRTRTLGTNVVKFFEGLVEAKFGSGSLPTPQNGQKTTPNPDRNRKNTPFDPPISMQTASENVE